jgi:cytochrome c peroxidase
MSRRWPSRWAMAGALALGGLSACSGWMATPDAQPAPPVSSAAELVPSGTPGLLAFDALEREAMARHGPWPPPPVPDAGNALSGKPEAVALGQQLFFDPRLSPSGRVSCASCHEPTLAFADGRARSVGLQPVDRHAPSLWNAVHERWQGWDGATDSLWSQSISALLDVREMASSAAHLRSTVARDAQLSCRLRAATGRELQGVDAEAVMVDLAKALGAFVATLVSPRTPFDEFRDALLRGDEAAAARYPLDAQRGLRLFIGRGQCALCHSGPRFSNGEFADTGLPFFSRPGVVDPGRHGGIEKLKASPYNRLSRWADPVDATSTRHVSLQPRHFGEFKVPGLRHVALTAPYMHDGQLATLTQVLRHYSELNEERLHADGEQILRPLRLSEGELADLRAFLLSLSRAGGLGWRATAQVPCTP